MDITRAREILKKHIDNNYESQQAFCDHIGIVRTSLWYYLNSTEIPEKICNEIGLEKLTTVSYRRKKSG